MERWRLLPPRQTHVYIHICTVEEKNAHAIGDDIENLFCVTRVSQRGRTLVENSRAQLRCTAALRSCSLAEWLNNYIWWQNEKTRTRKQHRDQFESTKLRCWEAFISEMFGWKHINNVLHIIFTLNPKAAKQRGQNKLTTSIYIYSDFTANIFRTLPTLPAVNDLTGSAFIFKCKGASCVSLDYAKYATRCKVPLLTVCYEMLKHSCR